MNAKLNFKQSFVAGLSAAGLATVINSILFFAFHAMGILVDTIFIQPNQPLTVVPIIISSVVPTLIASVVFFLIEKYTQKGFKIFSIVSTILVVVSFVNPFVGIPNVTTAYAIALNVMHVVVYGAILYFISKSIKNNVSA